MGAAAPVEAGELSDRPLQERAVCQCADQRTTVSVGGQRLRLRIARLDAVS